MGRTLKGMEFRVLASRPRIKFVVDRDSVCAGDDCTAHKIAVEAFSFVDPVALAEELSAGFRGLPMCGLAGEGF